MKYMGSKNRISNDIKLFIDLNRQSLDQTYIEPFCGGCNMIDKIRGKRIASDNNKYLISMWQELQKGYEFPDYIDRNIYNKAKLDFDYGTNKFYPDCLIGWIGFCASFNGKFFNAGYGGVSGGRNYIKEQINNIRKQLPKLKDVVFVHSCYSKLDIPKNSIIYCDPPYSKTESYDTGNFKHDLFYGWAIEKSQQGHKVFISEYWMPPERFDCIWSKKINTNISTKTQNKIEKLYIPKGQQIYKPLTLF